MPAARAASAREAPSSTSAKASIRRAARASRHRPASRRRPPAPSSRRVIATVIAPPPIGHTADQRPRAARGATDPTVRSRGRWYQRQLGVLEHRAGGERELLLAPVALEHLAGRERAEAAAAAGRAGQALAPAHGEERLPAGLLGAEALPELHLAQALDRASQAFCRRHRPLRQPRKPRKV